MKICVNHNAKSHILTKGTRKIKGIWNSESQNLPCTSVPIVIKPGHEARGAPGRQALPTLFKHPHTGPREGNTLLGQDESMWWQVLLIPLHLPLLLCRRGRSWRGRGGDGCSSRGGHGECVCCVLLLQLDAPTSVPPATNFSLVFYIRYSGMYIIQLFLLMLLIQICMLNAPPKNGILKCRSC